MTIWSSEIKELEKLHDSIKGKHPKLDNELQRLLKTDDENIVLVYARRCLELIITDLCERELKRDRGTEPLKGIIDKLNREKKVPHNIIVSMQNLNSLSTFGAHPKDFDPRQVKPVLLDLTTALEWYLKYMEDQETVKREQGAIQEKRKERAGLIRSRSKSRKRIIMVTSVLLVASIVVVSLIVFNVIGVGKQVRAGSIGSIIVLPFENYTGMDSLEYFVSGMHSSLIQDMGKIGNLHIPGTTTSKFYKNVNKTIAQITKETNVDAALETDVLCLGEDSICLNTRLIIPGREEEQLWIADYKIPRNQILNWYNRVTKQIAEEVKVKLTPRQEILLAGSKTVNEEAYDNYLKGIHYLDRLGEEDLEKAIEYFNHAIELEPDWAQPYVGLAGAYGRLKQMGFMSPGEATIQANKNLDKAIELDPDFPGSHSTKAGNSVWTEWDWEKGEREYKKALEINPNDVMSRIFYAHLLMILGRYDEALFNSQMAAELDPMNPLVLALSAVVDLNHGDVNLALEKCEKALTIDSNHYFALSMYENACYLNGDYKNLITTLLKYRAQMNDTIKEAISKSYQEKGFTAAIKTYLGFLEDYARSNYVTYCDLAFYYLWINNIEMGIENYKKAYEMHDPNIPYITTPLFGFEKIKDDPRIISIVKKMNLPLPKSN